ncbi:MAG: hypothetical protein WCJ71_03585 [Candidatus Omnitrophota bacterium]
MNLGDLQRFFGTHRGKKSRDTFGEHGFSATRRPDKKNFVISSHGYLQRPLSSLLPANL